MNNELYNNYKEEALQLVNIIKNINVKQENMVEVINKARFDFMLNTESARKKLDNDQINNIYSKLAADTNNIVLLLENINAVHKGPVLNSPDKKMWGKNFTKIGTSGFQKVDKAFKKVILDKNKITFIKHSYTDLEDFETTIIKAFSTIVPDKIVVEKVKSVNKKRSLWNPLNWFRKKNKNTDIEE